MTSTARGSDRSRRRHVTISDVARAAGVAQSTVSYALSGKRSVSEEVRRRIQDTIAELGYEPHAGARALASRRSQIVGLVMPLRRGVYVPILMEFAAAIVTEARAHDHDVLLLTGDADTDGLRRVANGSLADAVILMDVEEEDPRIPSLRELGRPSVLIGLPEDHDDLVCTDLDWAAAGRIGVEHLVALGHRRIGLLGQPPEVYERHTGFAQRFLRGLRDAADEHDVDAASQPCEATFGDVRRGLDRLDEALSGLTCLIVHNEAVMPLLLEELAARQIAVPGDLSVVSVEPDSMVRLYPLSAVTIPVDDIGRSAVHLVMRQLEGHTVMSSTLLPPRLVDHGSTAGPHPG